MVCAIGIQIVTGGGGKIKGGGGEGEGLIEDAPPPAGCICVCQSGRKLAPPGQPSTRRAGCLLLSFFDIEGWVGGSKSS